MSNPNVETGNLTLHLLDSSTGNPIQSWHFQDTARVTIGRSSQNEISLAEGQISRLHVELLYKKGKWELNSLGKNGTKIDGELVTQVNLKEQTIFQLGMNGPSFKFLTIEFPTSSVATMDNIDPEMLSFLEIDFEKQSEEVEQIVETDAFRQLQEQAKKFKEQK